MRFDLGFEVDLNEERGYKDGLPVRGRACPRHKSRAGGGR